MFASCHWGGIELGRGRKNRSDKEREESNRRNAATNAELDEAEEKRSKKNEQSEALENASNSKSTYYRVDGGTNTAFTSYFYTEDYNTYREVALKYLLLILVLF